MAVLPEQAGDLLDVIGKVCRRKDVHDLCDILESASPSYVEVDSWGGESTILNLVLKLPFDTYFALENRRDQIEASLKSIADTLPISDGFRRLHEIRLDVDLASPLLWRSHERPLQATPEETQRLWEPGRFRLFLSHSSEDKEFAATLRSKLSKVHIDLFVAHEAIKPNAGWLHEIKLALASCQAVLFLCSKPSNDSTWCQQEIGWALGRGILITTYKYGAVPGGFAGPSQAWKKPGDDWKQICEELLTVLISDDLTESSMREPLVQWLQTSTNARALDYRLSWFEKLKLISLNDLSRIAPKLEEKFVLDNTELRSRLLSALEKFGYESPQPGQTQQPEEYDPFADD